MTDCAECKQQIKDSPWCTQTFDNGTEVHYCWDHRPDVFRQAKPMFTTVPRELIDYTPKEIEALKNNVSLDEFVEDEEEIPA